MEVVEGGRTFYVDDGVFFNPHMEKSRTFVSLLIKKLPKLRILDAFSASGIRGIRYWLENPNVEEVAFLDVSEIAVKNIRRNLELHSLEGKVFRENFLAFQDFTYNFIELDPFGSPARYVEHAIYLLSYHKEAYLSVTATDTAVLCGKHWQACLKNYGSLPKRDRTCHETAVRILLKFIAQRAWLYDFAFYPLVSFYYRHQIKIVGKLVKGASLVQKQLFNIGYIYEDEQGQKYWSTFKELKALPYAGPLWIADLHSADIVKDLPGGEIFLEELGMPPFHYNIHEIAKKYKIARIPSIKEILRRFPAKRTHFSPLGIKFAGSIKELVEVMSGF